MNVLVAFLRVIVGTTAVSHMSCTSDFAGLLQYPTPLRRVTEQVYSKPDCLTLRVADRWFDA